MKIMVVRRDDAKEVIYVRPPVEVKVGDNLCLITSKDGVEHYFDHNGYYDGHGEPVVDPGF